MSLVGPRPLPEDEHERISGRFRRRVDLMPGLTGLWQVHGRSNIPFDGMVDLDYLYVTNWSLWRDVKLLIRTMGVVVRGSGASPPRAQVFASAVGIKELSRLLKRR